MFIEDNDTTQIVIHYKKTGKTYVAYGDQDFKEVITDEKEKEKFKKLTVNMKIITWGTYNDLQETSSVYDQGLGRNVFNFKRYKEEKLRRLISSWDATKVDKDGKTVPVPVNEKSIMSLAPSIAEALISQYDDVSILDDEDEKK